MLDQSARTSRMQAAAAQHRGGDVRNGFLGRGTCRTHASSEALPEASPEASPESMPEALPETPPEPEGPAEVPAKARQ